MKKYLLVFFIIILAFFVVAEGESYTFIENGITCVGEDGSVVNYDISELKYGVDIRLEEEIDGVVTCFEGSSFDIDESNKFSSSFSFEEIDGALQITFLEEVDYYLGILYYIIPEGASWIYSDEFHYIYLQEGEYIERVNNFEERESIFRFTANEELSGTDTTFDFAYSVNTNEDVSVTFNQNENVFFFNTIYFDDLVAGDSIDYDGGLYANLVESDQYRSIEIFMTEEDKFQGSFYYEIKSEQDVQIHLGNPSDEDESPRYRYNFELGSKGLGNVNINMKNPLEIDSGDDLVAEYEELVELEFLMSENDYLSLLDVVKGNQLYFEDFETGDHSIQGMDGFLLEYVVGTESNEDRENIKICGKTFVDGQGYNDFGSGTSIAFEVDFENRCEVRECLFYNNPYVDFSSSDVFSCIDDYDTIQIQQGDYDYVGSHYDGSWYCSGCQGYTNMYLNPTRSRGDYLTFQVEDFDYMLKNYENYYLDFGDKMKIFDTWYYKIFAPVELEYLSAGSVVLRTKRGLIEDNGGIEGNLFVEELEDLTKSSYTRLEGYSPTAYYFYADEITDSIEYAYEIYLTEGIGLDGVYCYSGCGNSQKGYVVGCDVVDLPDHVDEYDQVKVYSIQEECSDKTYAYTTSEEDVGDAEVLSSTLSINQGRELAKAEKTDKYCGTATGTSGMGCNCNADEIDENGGDHIGTTGLCWESTSKYCCEKTESSRDAGERFVCGNCELQNAVSYNICTDGNTELITFQECSSLGLTYAHSDITGALIDTFFGCSETLCPGDESRIMDSCGTEKKCSTDKSEILSCSEGRYSTLQECQEGFECYDYGGGAIACTPLDLIAEIEGISMPEIDFAVSDAMCSQDTGAQYAPGDTGCGSTYSVQDEEYSCNEGLLPCYSNFLPEYEMSCFEMVESGYRAGTFELGHCCNQGMSMCKSAYKKAVSLGGCGYDASEIAGIFCQMPEEEIFSQAVSGTTDFCEDRVFSLTDVTDSDYRNYKKEYLCTDEGERECKNDVFDSELKLKCYQNIAIGENNIKVTNMEDINGQPFTYLHEFYQEMQTTNSRIFNDLYSLIADMREVSEDPNYILYRSQTETFVSWMNNCDQINTNYVEFCDQQRDAICGECGD
jgi:hypothetical protein